LDAAWDGAEDHDLSTDRIENLYQSLISKPNTKTNYFRLWPGIAAAVVVGLLIVFSGQFFKQDQPSQQAAASQKNNRILPGRNQAVLTLSDGRKIALNDGISGHLATEENVEIKKVGNGQVQYAIKGDLQSRQPQYNTISTPRGGEYSIILPDGTKVWLNAQSSLTYPVYFSGKERVVKIQGEAYFEVAKNKAMPFKVLSDAVEVKVLGTHFNVMAYPDELSVQTTLLEGSVSINNRLLKPGQQAQTVKANSLTSIGNVNTDDVIAWKNGRFSFRNEDIQSIMKKISRWYDVDVEFKDKNILNKNFGGSFSRFDNVSEMLHVMELTGVIHFKIEGRRIVVMQ
jgi:ferric-dicitrate binding protein FerR (iron transport regulator)